VRWDDHPLGTKPVRLYVFNVTMGLQSCPGAMHLKSALHLHKEAGRLV
jgi:hypothetical protein